MAEKIRVVDIGGDGFRKVDIPVDTEFKVENIEDQIKKITIEKPKEPESIKDLPSLMNFVIGDLDADKNNDIVYSVAGVIEGHDLVKESPNAHFLDGIRLATKTKEESKKRKRPRIRSAVFNDMEAAVTGMHVLLPKERYFMGITWSTGIGLRIWSDGKILSVAEGGHMVLDPSPFAPLCGCGKRGHAEAIIGGGAIERRIIVEAKVLELTKKLEITLGKDKDQVRPAKFLDKAYLGDYSGKAKNWARDFYRRVIQGMGIFLANIQTLLNLPLIVWKGTLAHKALWDKLSLLLDVRAAMREHLIDPTWAREDKLRLIETPGPGDWDAFIGAAEAFKALAKG